HPYASGNGQTTPSPTKCYSGTTAGNDRRPSTTSAPKDGSPTTANDSELKRPSKSSTQQTIATSTAPRWGSGLPTTSTHSAESHKAPSSATGRSRRTSQTAR